jgi:hypothetical protein
MVPTGRETKQDFWDSWVSDFRLFAREVVKIHVPEERAEALGLTDDEIAFIMNPAQDMLHDMTRKMEPTAVLAQAAMRHRVRVMVLKARQVGSSTFWVLWFLWRCITSPGTRVALVAQASASAKTILRIAAYAVERLPAWMKAHPMLKCKSSTQALTFANGSRMSAGTANSEFWRGASLDGALLTEVTSYDDLKKTLSTVTRACAGPVCMESTAKGMGLFKDIWDDGRGSWKKVFISWMMDPFCELEHTDIEPTAQCLSYIKEHKLTLRKANWYLETKWTEFAGDQQQFDQECPATPELAFIVAGSRFFVGRVFQFDPREMPPGERFDWEKPRAGRKYTLGVDVAFGGEGNDASTGVLLDVTDLRNVTVASVIQAWKPTPMFGDMLVQLCKDYGNVLACVESNIGLDVIRTLKRAGIKQYVRQVDGKMIDQMDEYGFRTSHQTRPLLMANLTRYIMGNIIRDLRDPRLKDECNNFAYNERGKPEAARGKHDDLVFALALALEAISQYVRLNTPVSAPRIPDRPVHDQSLALQWDIKYGYRPQKVSPY